MSSDRLQTQPWASRCRSELSDLCDRVRTCHHIPSLDLARRVFPDQMSIKLQTNTSKKRTLCNEPEAGLRFESDTRVTLERTTEDMANGRNLAQILIQYMYYFIYKTKNNSYKMFCHI